MKFLFKGEVIDYDYHFQNHEKTILLLHGYGGDKNSFANILPLLKSKFNVLTITIPTTQNMTSIWDMFDYLHLVENVLNIHNISSVSIICHSFGFRIATLIKNTKIEKIVVTGGAGPNLKSRFEKMNIANSKILNRNKRFDYLKHKLESADYQNLSSTNKKTFQNIIAFDTKKLLKFEFPILLFWGRNDKDTKLKIAKFIKRKNNAILKIINSDHFAYLNCSVEFKHSVMEFLCG